MADSPIRSLSPTQKAALVSGADFWHTESCAPLGLPAIMLTDGPQGLRKQAGGPGSADLPLGTGVPATCFPPAVALGSSWDPDLVRRVGEALGAEASIEGVGVLLGPGINIKRSPLCGRNFEYFSEDPLIAGTMGAAMVEGVQSKGVGASVKHFAANNQETDRMRVSADVDARALHEIYLRAFERVVRRARPWTVMCSYNRINDVPASQDHWLLTDLLRGQWGFDGVVVSDWGAVSDRLASLSAGVDLEMPGTAGRTDTQVLEALAAGALDEETLDIAAGRVGALLRRASVGAGQVSGPLDADAHHRLAREAAGRSMVLLRNRGGQEGGLLPLRPEARIAVIGAFAEQPRYQGSGSSRINPTRLDTALAEIRSLATGEAAYSPGFSLGPDTTEDRSAALRRSAASAAAGAEVAVVFLGLDDAAESEGYDRTGIDLPADQLALLDDVLAANPNTVVVLSNGGVVALPFADRAPAILEAWLGGQAGGGAVADILFGRVNPSGRLTETIPVRLADSPAFLNFPGEHGHVRYGEGIFVGYRWYDARDLEVAFPFGHGLSYTTFEYGPVSAQVDDGDITVRVPVTNSGAVAGREVVQAYVSVEKSAVARPPRELKGFRVVEAAPGQSVEAELVIRHEDLAYWDIRIGKWRVEAGTYRIGIGASSRDIRTTVEVEVPDGEETIPLNWDSTLGELMAHPVAGPAAARAMAAAMEGFSGAGDLVPGAMERVAGGLPLRALLSLGGDAVTPEVLNQLIVLANGSPHK